MREFGKIITRKTDLTDAQVQEKYKFPAIIILHDNEDQILKITHYQKNGTKTIYDFSLSASKQFVTDSIATAIAGLQDNRLEYNEFSDFPAIGDETKFYIDLTDDRIYIWDSYSQSYKNQSWDTATIASIQASISSLQNNKLDKGTYTGDAGNLKSLIDTKISGTVTANYIPKSTATGTIANSIVYDNGTNVGISNTDPRAKLSVGSNNGGSKIMPTNTKVWIQGSGGASSTDLQSRISFGFNENPDYGFYFGNINVDYGATPMIGVLGTRDASVDKPVLYIKDSKVGVNTMNPTEKLEVGGRTKSDGQVFNETTSAILPREIKFKSGNFVAAGNDGVEKKLLREGDALTLPSVFKYGYGSGNVTSNNVFGIDALNSNTTGSNNAAFGRSLVLNTTGSRNSAFGSYACLFYNTSGNDNSAFGYSALMMNQTGSYNCAYGVEALKSNTASNNSAFGYFSLRANSSGNNNAGFGQYSLASNTTGINNIAFGGYSLQGNTTGNNNTAGGSGSGQNLTTGSANTLLGAFAGTYLISLENALSYSNCTYIGEFTKPSANGVTNEIAIGKDSKGQGSNTATIGNENTDTLHLLKNGAGIVLKSPDGTKKVKISIDNSGNLITTLIT